MIQLKSDPKRMLLLNDCYKTVSDHFFAISMFILNKIDVQRLSLRCLTDLNPNLLKSYDTKSKYFHFRFLRFCKLRPLPKENFCNISVCNMYLISITLVASSSFAKRRIPEKSWRIDYHCLVWFNRECCVELDISWNMGLELLKLG